MHRCKWEKSAILENTCFVSVRELDSGSRAFLVFVMFNAVSWQCVTGLPLALLARSLGMPESLLGILLSGIPLSMVLVVFTGRLVKRWGPKRLMIVTWTLRNLAACTVFLIPYAVSHWGVEAGWYVLLIATVSFCLMRSLGVGAWYPWLHEIVCENRRGAYAQAEATVIQVIGAILAALQVATLQRQSEPGLTRFLSLFGVGILAGFASVHRMGRCVPGGRALPCSEGRQDSMAVALSDRSFVAFVMMAALCSASVVLLGSSSVLWMREQLQLAPGHVAALMGGGAAAVLLAMCSLPPAKDNNHGQSLAVWMTICTVASISYLVMPARGWTFVQLALTVTVQAVSSTAYTAAVNRAMLDRIPAAQSRVSYSNLYLSITNGAQGTALILSGFAMEHGTWGYRVCFAFATIMGAAGALLCLRLDAHGSSLHRLPRPALRRLSTR